jgi:hypothetical protein
MIAVDSFKAVDIFKAVAVSIKGGPQATMSLA